MHDYLHIIIIISIISIIIIIQMNILVIAPILSDTNKTTDFLRNHHLPSNNELCCNTPMYKIPFHCSDDKMFRFHTCWEYRSIRLGSLFENSNKSLCTLLLILIYFVMMHHQHMLKIS